MTNLMMNPDLRTSGLQILKAALKPDPLNGWSEIIANLLQAEVAAVTVFGPNRDVVAIGCVNAERDKSSTFVNEHQFSNPLRDFWHQAQCGESLRMEDAFDCDKMRNTAFYSTYRDDLDLGKGVCLAMDFSRSKVLISASRPKSATIQDFDLAPVRALIEDIRLGFEVSGAMWRSEIVIKSLLQNFNHNNIGAAVLDVNGDTIEMNDILHAAIEDNILFSQSDRRIEIGPMVAPCGFSEARRRAIQTGRNTKVNFKAENGKDLATIFLNPMPDLGSWGATNPGRMILLYRKAGEYSMLSSKALTAQFSLTPVECRVAGLLHGGHTSGLIAQMLNVQTNTVRAHLKSIFAKTGTHSQVELLVFLKNLVI